MFVLVFTWNLNKNGILSDSLNAIYWVFGIIDIGTWQIPNMEFCSLNVILIITETRQKGIMKFIRVEVFFFSYLLIRI